MKQWPSIAVCILFTATLSPIRAQGYYSLTRIVEEGEAVPDLGGLVVQRIVQVRSNQAGTLAFTAEFGPAASSAQAPQRIGVFCQSQGSARLLAELADTTYLYSLAVNDHGTVAVAGASDGVEVFSRFGPFRHVGPGDPAPVQPAGTTFSSFETESDGFLDPEDEVVFVSTLSDGRTGLFRLASSGVDPVALEGAPVPDRPGVVFGQMGRPYQVGGQAVAFRAGRDYFVSDGFTIRTLVYENQPLPSGGVVTGVSAIAVNRLGEVALASVVSNSRPRLTILSGDLQIPVLDESVELPGFENESRHFSPPLYLDDSDRVYFGMADPSHGGIYRWQGGTITKIAADGDPGPTGGVLEVSFYCCPAGPPPPFMLTVSFTRPNPLGDVAFEAVDSVVGLRPFLWRSGRIDLVDYLPGPQDNRLLLSLSLLGVEGDGSVLTSGIRCCGVFPKALYRAALAPRRAVLPYVAGGGTGMLQIGTNVELSNASPYPVTTGFTPVSQPGTLFNPTPTGPALEPGASAEVPSRSNGPLESGFAVIDSEGGGLISSNASVRLKRAGQLISLVNIPASQPVRKAGLLVDQSGPADTGVALSNVGESPIDLTATLSDLDGSTVGESTLHLESGGQISRFASDLFPVASEPDFLGSLRIESEDDFVMAGLRQSELLLSALPAVTSSSAPHERGLSGYLAAGTLQVLHGETGSLAVLEGSQGGGRFAVRVITPEGTFPVLDQGTTLPGGEVPSGGGPPATLISLNRDLELLVAVRLNDGRVGLYLWKNGEIQKLLVSGDQVEGFSVQLPIDARAYSRNRQGKIAAGGAQVVVFDPAPRLVLTSDTPVRAGGPTSWGSFQGVQVDDDGTVYLMTRSFLARTTGTQVQLLAEAGQVLLAGRPPIGPQSFERIQLGRDGELLVAFSALPPLGGLTVLVRYSQGSFQEALAPNRPVQGLPGFGVHSFDTQGFQVNSGGDVLIRATVREFATEEFRLVFLRLPFDGQPPILFAAATESDWPGFPEGADFNLRSGFSYSWSDAGLLLLQASDNQDSGAAFLIGPSGTVKLVSEGDVFADGPNGETIQVFRVNRAAGFGAVGEPLVDVLLADGNGSEEAVLVGLGEGLREVFLPVAASTELTGIRIDSRVLLSNQGETVSTVTLEPTRQDGRTLPLIEVGLEPGQVRAVLLDLQEDFQGWIRVRSQGGSLVAQERLSLFRGAELVAEATVPQSGLRTRGVIDTRFASVFQTGLAVANPWNGPVAVNLTLDTGDPATTRTQRIVLDSRSQQSRFVSDIFPSIIVSGSAGNPEPPPEGIVRIDSEAPVAMIALRQEGLVFTTQAID